MDPQQNQVIPPQMQSQIPPAGQPASAPVQQPQPAQPAAQPAPTQPLPQMTAPAAAPVAGQPAAAPSTQPPNQDTPLSTQSSLLISELRDNIVIMKDGSFRAVVACQSINFDLMSNTEREGVEYSYQNFLNSLSFTTQILIRSQRVDISPYIERLTDIRRNTDNMLLTVLMDDYINFIDNLSQAANIMDKSFFICVPYYSSPEAEKSVQETKNFVTALTRNRNEGVYKIDRATYDKAISELNNRVDTVIAGLAQIGIHSVRLDTRGLSELYYNFNNPDTAIREPLADFSRIATTYVKKGDEPNV